MSKAEPDSVPTARRLHSSCAALAALLVLSATSTARLPTAAAQSSTPPIATPGSGLQGAPATSTPASRPGVDKAVTELTRRVTSWGGKLGVSIIDVQSGTALSEVNPKLVLNPASTMKLLTAAVLLDRLGPNYRFTTSLHGVRQGNQVNELVLRGRGDPSLRTTDLLRMAVSLKNSGVSKVGEILVDQSYFDAQFVPPAFDQQPDEWAPFRAPVSAIALDGNSVTLNVMPSTAGSPASVWFEPDGWVSNTGQVTTQTATGKQNIGWTLSAGQNSLLSKISGNVASNLGRQRFRKRVHDPRLLPGYALKRMLGDLGVAVGDRVSEGGANIEPQLVWIESQPLAVLLAALGKDSDNFYAEMLLKVLGATVSGAAGTSAAGSQAIVDWLQQQGTWVPGTHVINGSGLFDANRVSAWTLSRTLRAAYLTPRLQPEYVNQLSIAGVDGTLKNRLTAFGPSRSVRAKTGTLNATVALSGYLLRNDQNAIAFTLIVDGVKGRPGEIRQLFDAVVTELGK
jgi:D-alanyl-D-alanine carboxypeptidase/D-alanyl-D-alanine-endopeptidase (penicillin-binding protein 4)